MGRWEEIIKASEDYANQEVYPIEQNKRYCNFKNGAEWADRTMIDRICEWLEKHLYDEAYIFRDNEGTWIDIESVIEDLRTVSEK